MADFELSGSFNISQITSSIEEASSEMQEFASGVVSSLGQVIGAGTSVDTAFAGVGEAVASSLIPTVGAIQAAGEAANNLLTSFGAVGDEATVTSTQLSSIAPTLSAIIPTEVAFNNALAQTLAQLDPLKEEAVLATSGISSLESSLSAAIPAETAFSQQLDVLFEALAPAQEEIGSLTADLVPLPGVLTEAGTALSALAEDSGVAAEGLQSFYESLGGVSPGLETLDEAIAATGIQLDRLESQLSGTQQQLTLFGGSIGSILTPEQEAAIALEEHEQGLAGLRDTLVALQPALSAYGLEITDITSALRAMAEAQTGVGTTTVAAPTAEVTQTTGSFEQLISTEEKASESGMELSEVFENLLHVLSAVSKAAGELGSESAEQLSKGLEDVIGPLSGTLTLGPTVTAVFQGIKQVFDNLGPSLNSTTEGFNLLGQASRSAATEAAAAFAELAATPPPTPPTPPKPPVQAALPFPITDESLSVLSEQTAAVDSSTTGWEHYITTENQVTEASSATTVAISETDAALQELASAQVSTASTTNQLDAGLLAMAEAQTAVIEPITETVTQLGILDAGLAEMAAAQTQTATSAVELDGALGIMAEAQASVASAMDPVLAEMAEAQAEFESASVSLGQYNNLTAEGVVRHVSLQRAINVLNTELKEGAGNAEAVNAAYQKVQTAAQQLGYQIRETANGFTLFNAEVKASGGGISNINGLIGQVGGRMVTLEAGVGQLGFAFGLLARTLAPLNAVMVAAFPLISLVLVADIIQAIVDKFKKVEDEIRKTTLAFDDFASTSRSSADAIELTNLKLEDQINKLEGRPTVNKLQIALVESQAAADKLTKSLADSIEKALQLIEKSDVSFFKSLYTGLEPTSAFFGLGDSFGKAKQTLESYGLSVEKVRQAQLQLEKDTEGLSAQQIEDKKRLVGSNISLDEQAVSKAQDAAAKKEDTFKGELTALQNSINARREALSKPQVYESVTEYGQIVKTELPALSEGELDKRFGQEQTAVTQLQNAFDALDLAQQREAKSNRLRSDEARSSINDESYAREKLLSLPTFKGDLESGKETAASKKQQAEESFKISQEAASREIEEQVKTGVSRVQAEQNVAPQVIAARTKLRDALLDANKVQFDAELDFLTKEASLLASDPNQGRREADLRTNLTAQQKLRADNARTIQAIESGQSTALVQIDTETVKRQEQIERDYFLRSAELKISETRRGTSEQITAINEVMGAISSRYPEDYDLYAKYQKLKNQATVEFVQRQRQIQATEEEIEKAHSLSALESRRDYTNAVSSLEFSTAEQRRSSLERVTSEEYDLERAALERKMELYNSDTVEFERTRKELVALNDKYNRQIYQDTLAAWSDNEKPVKDFVDSSTNALNTFTENVFTSNQSIQRDLQSLFLSIVRDFTKMILEMIEKTALFKTIQRELEAGLNKIFRIPATPAPPLTPGAGATGVAIEGFPSATPPPPTVSGVYPGVYPGVTPPAGSFGGLPTLPTVTPTLGPAPPTGPAATSLSQLGQTPAENLEAQTLIKNEITSYQQIVNNLQGQPGSEAAIADYNRQIAALKQQQVTQIQAAINAPKPEGVSSVASASTPAVGTASSNIVLSAASSTPVPVTIVSAPGSTSLTASAPLGTGVNTGTGGAGVAAVSQENAQKQNLYQQDVTRFKASQVEKVAAAGLAGAGILAATTGHQKLAIALEVAATAIYIEQQIRKAAVHTAAKAQETVATVAANATQVASTAAAGTATVAITTATTTQSKLQHAKSAAAGAWDAMAGIPIIGPALGAIAAAATFAAILAFKEGGHVLGAGTGTSDSIPAMLSHGEYVIKADTVSKPGVLSHLNQLNSGDVSAIHRENRFAGGGLVASKHVEEAINAEKGGGSYLNPTIRREMGQSLNADFSNVRVHTDRRASDLSEALGAHAFTVGRDVFFNRGVYDEKSQFGRNVIAHELVHTIQHGESQPRGAMKVSHPNDAFELEAYSTADKVTREYFSKSDSTRIEKSMLPMYEKGGDIYKDGPIYAHKGETVVSAFDTSRILLAAKAGAVMDSKLYKPSVSLSPSIVNLVNLAKLGMVPAKQLSVGSNVQLASSPQQDSHDNHNFNFNYNPQFGKDFNLGEHGPAIAGYMIQTLRRAGYKV